MIINVGGKPLIVKGQYFERQCVPRTSEYCLIDSVMHNGLEIVAELSTEEIAEVEKEFCAKCRTDVSGSSEIKFPSMLLDDYAEEEEPILAQEQPYWR